MQSINEKAHQLFLEQNGLYSQDAQKWTQVAVENNSELPSMVVAPIEDWSRYIGAVGIENARCLLSTVLGEINALQNHWSITNYYRALSSGTYSLDDALYFFSRLEEGSRTTGAREFVQRYKTTSHLGNVEATLPALGLFASYLVVTSTFVQNLYDKLDQFNGGYYSRMCEVAVNGLTEDMLRLGFTQRQALMPFMALSPLDNELPIICSGNGKLLIERENSRRETIRAHQIITSNFIVQNLIDKLKNQKVSY